MPKFSPQDSIKQTEYNKTEVLSIYLKFLDLKEDNDRNKRIALGFCLNCYYIRKYDTEQVSETVCGICDTICENTTGKVHLLCNDCSIKFSLCVLCGGNWDNIIRRSLTF